MINIKKYILLGVQACLFNSIAYGLPVGNPGEISALWEGVFFSDDLEETAVETQSFISLKSGFYGNYVFNRFLKTNVSDKSSIINIVSEYDPNKPLTPGIKYNNSALNQKIHSSQSFTNAGYFGCNFKNRVEFFGIIGVSKESIEGPSSAFNLAGTFSVTPIDLGITPLNDALNKGLVKICTAADYSWGSGIKCSIINTDNFASSISLQYSSSNLNIERIAVLSEALTFQISDPLGYKSDVLNQGILPNILTTPPNKRASLNCDEWQTSLGVAYRLNDFIPYLAFKFSQVHLKSDNIVIPEPVETFNLRPSIEIASPSESTITGGIRSVCLKLNNLKSRKHYGLAFGTSFIEDDRISVTVEGRLIDESAFYVNALFRF